MKKPISTLKLLVSGNASIPAATAWYVSDLGEFRGKQELYTRQSLQRLKALREHALIGSAASSNRIEGVSVDPSRVRYPVYETCWFRRARYFVIAMRRRCAATARAQVEKLPPATLAKAFRGELVRQDPNDEPASVSLERIRSGRGEQISGKSKRGRRPSAWLSSARSRPNASTRKN